MKPTIRSAIALAGAILLAGAGALQAATGTLFPAPWFLALDAAGNPINGAKACFYTAGTSTPATTYSDVALTTPNTNPVVADSAGRVGPIFLTPGQSYKLILQDATGTALTCNGAVVRTQDNIAATPAAAANVDITGTAGETLSAGQVVYLSDGSGAKTAGQWFKADSTNTYSSTTPIVGIVPSAIASAASGTIRIAGSVTGLSSLTIGASYYVGAAGAMTSTAPANKRFIGEADTTSSLVLAANPSTNFSVIAPALTNGQLLIGSTGVAPVAAALTAGNGISTTTGAGTLTVTNTGGRAIDTQTPFITSGCVASGTGGCVSNSTNEVTIYTFSVAGGTLSTNKTLHLSLIGDHLINNGGADSVRLKVKFGATTICDGTVAVVNFGANRGSVQVSAEIMAAGGTGAQRTWCTFQIGDSTQNNAAGTMGSVSGTNTYTMYGVHNAVAEDSTASKALVVTATLGTANAAIDLRAHTVVTDVR